MCYTMLITGIQLCSAVHNIMPNYISCLQYLTDFRVIDQSKNSAVFAVQNISSNHISIIDSNAILR